VPSRLQCVRLSAIAVLFVGAGSASASPITLSYTQYFDFPGIAGHPSATWTAVFDLATHPTNPYAGSSPSMNGDFISDGLLFFDTKPLISWDGDKILIGQPVFVRSGGTTYVEAPATTFDHCNQPCTDVAARTDFAFAVPPGLVGLQAQTLDVFSGSAAPVPEPGAFALVLLGLAALSATRWRTGIAQAPQP
jgi:hypothetical protein